ncbi:MAG: CBS domain-containing protein [Conexivisphaera sp.]
MGSTGKRREMPLRVSDIMVRDVQTVGREEPLSEITRRMHEHRIGSVVVVDESGRPLGIVTERDIVYACARGLPSTTPAWMVMTEDPITVKDTDLVTEAIGKMREADVRHLPVVDSQGKLVGIVSFRDFMDLASILLSS